MSEAKAKTKAKPKSKAKAKTTPKAAGSKLKQFIVVTPISCAESYPVFAAEKANWAPKAASTPVVGIVPAFGKVKMDPTSAHAKRWLAMGAIK